MRGPSLFGGDAWDILVVAVIVVHDVFIFLWVVDEGAREYLGCFLRSLSSRKAKYAVECRCKRGDSPALAAQAITGAPPITLYRSLFL